MIYNDLITADFDKTFIENLVRTYSAGIYHDQIYTSSISFAWEDSDEKKTYLSELCNHIASTNVLIIIGYSFPFFNREIDRKIIGSMKNIEKVYFQAPDADNIKERFQAIRDDLDGKILVTRFDLDQFLLPNEL